MKTNSQITTQQHQEGLVRTMLTETVLNKRFPQQLPLTPSFFSSFSRDYFYPWKIESEELEYWEQRELLFPVLRIQSKITVHKVLEGQSGEYGDWETEPLTREPYAEENTVRVLEDWSNLPWPIRTSFWQTEGKEFVLPIAEGHFTPWEQWTHKDEDSGFRTQLVYSYYHPYQILRAWEIRNARLCPINYMNFQVSTTDSARSLRHINQELERQVQGIKNEELWWMRCLTLLLGIEDRYLPTVRESLVSYDGKPDGRRRWYEWMEAFDAQEKLQSSDFSIQEIQDMRHHYARRARSFDPASSLYPLLRHMNRKWRGKVKREMKLAWDYYEIADILGLFLKDLTGENQRHTDDLQGGGRWKHSYFGIAAENFDYGKKNALPAILREMGLDTRSRFLVFVEGPSEETYFSTWCHQRGIYLAELGVEVVNLSGIPSAQNTILLQYLGRARKEKLPVLAILDRENNADEKVEVWCNEGYLERRISKEECTEDLFPVGGLVWDSCFESDNFSDESLIDIWIELLHQRECSIPADKLRQIAQNAYNRRNRDKRQSSLIEALMSLGENSNLVIEKPAIAERLAEKFGEDDLPINFVLRRLTRCAIVLEFAHYTPGEAGEKGNIYWVGT